MWSRRGVKSNYFGEGLEMLYLDHIPKKIVFFLKYLYL